MLMLAESEMTPLVPPLSAVTVMIRSG